MILKESISYYVQNQSSVFCTFLEASKAFVLLAPSAFALRKMLAIILCDAGE